MSLTLTGASTFTGETTLDFSPSPKITSGPRLTLSGGSSLASSVLNVRSGARLMLEASASGATDRLGDTAEVRLRSGELRFADLLGGTLAKTETIGVVSVTGDSRITLASQPSATATLQVAALQRVERGTLLVAGLNGRGKLFSTSAPALVGGGAASGPATSIVPWAFGDASVEGPGSSFVTYTQADGFRLLDLVTDYATTLTAGSNRNVRLTSGAALVGTAIVNSLWLAGSSPVTGAGRRLDIISGALVSSTTTSFAPDIGFGPPSNVEGIITTLAGTLTLSGRISTTGGLTKNGAGTLALQAVSSFSGPLTINAGLISFSAINQLGTDPAAIGINGPGAGLSYTGSGVATLNRSLVLNAGVGLLSVSGSGELTLAGGTQGPGGLEIRNSATGSIRLAGTATHTGPTILGGGRVRFSSDAALGGSDLGFTTGAVLELSGAWTTARRIAFDVPVALQTNGFDVTWSGPLTGSGTITKTTPGNLRITSASGLTSRIDFATGRLEIGGAGAVESTRLTLTDGATLRLDNALTASNDRVAGPGAVWLTNSELRLEGNAVTLVDETINSVVANHSTGKGRVTITLTAPGRASTTLRIHSLLPTSAKPTYPSARPPVLVRGDSLGGAAGSPFTRLVLSSAGTATAFRPDIVVNDLSGLNSSFAIHDGTSDAAGTIGIRPLAASEYQLATNIQNPANGGTTPLDAHLLLEGAGTATGTENFAQTLTLGADSALTLTLGQTLGLSRGALLSRSGARLAGGTIDGGGSPVSAYVTGDLRLASRITTQAGQFDKLGPGTLILEDGADLPALVTANDGTIRLRDPAALADSLVSLTPLASLELTGPASVGSLAGEGTVQLGSHVLTLGTLPADLSTNATFAGTGSLRLVDGGRPDARRTLTQLSSVSGGITLASGVLVLSNSSSLGTPTLTVEGGALEGPATGLTLASPLVLNGTLDVRSRLLLGAGASVTGAGNLLVRTGSLEIQSAVDFPGSVTVEASPGLSQFKVTNTGSLRAQRGIFVGADVTLDLAESARDSTTSGAGRLADDTPVTLRSGRLLYRNNIAGQANVSETIGALRFAGFSTLQTQPDPGSSVTLLATSLDRIERGTLKLQAGGSVRLATAPATREGGVLPYAMSSTGGVVVHEAASGLRELTAADTPHRSLRLRPPAICAGSLW